MIVPTSYTRFALIYVFSNAKWFLIMLYNNDIVCLSELQRYSNTRLDYDKHALADIIIIIKTFDGRTIRLKKNKIHNISIILV